MYAARFGILLLVALLSLPAVADVGSTFTYQGQLKQSGAPANGDFDLEFRLYDAATAGNQIGNAVMMPAVPVVNGLFTVELNAGGEFGSDPFNGQARWLQVTVSGQPLTPRQSLTATPHASYAGTARRLALPFEGSANPALEALFKVTNTNAGGRFGGIFQITGTGNDSRALTGLATGSSGLTYGLFGDSNSTEGIGVYGETSGHAGVQGVSKAASRVTYGMYGESSNSSQGRGVCGLGHYGVEGIAADASGYGGVFLGAGPLGSGNALLVGGDAEIQGQIVGNLGVGTDAPDVKLHVVGGNDSAPAGGGYIQTGSSTSTNISIDNNEIMARDNGATSTLYLNANGGNVSLVNSGSGGVAIGSSTVPAGVKLNVQGGDVMVGGAIDIGLMEVAGPSGVDMAVISCPAGMIALSGGCHCNGELGASIGSKTGWFCNCWSGVLASSNVLCGRAK